MTFRSILTWLSTDEGTAIVLLALGGGAIFGLVLTIIWRGPP
jgi:hypothetical protein